MDPNRFVVGSETVIRAGDADLDHQDLRDSNGVRVTEDATERFTRERRRQAGRPALAGTTGVSPSMAFRLPVGLRHELQAIADREGLRVSAVARLALEEYVEHHRAS